MIHSSARDSITVETEQVLIEKYDRLYRLAYSYVHNEDDALDIVQESVYKAIKNAGKVQQESYIRTWLWRIVMNTAVDFIRSRKNETELEAAGETGKEDTYRDFDTLEALKVLDERERTVVVLRFFEDQKLEDIARTLQENTNTVKTILYRSLKKLRVELTEGELLYEG